MIAKYVDLPVYLTIQRGLNVATIAITNTCQ